MYDSRIISAEAQSAAFRDRAQCLRTMIATISECARITASLAAVQGASPSDMADLIPRYARAGALVRRRVDAMAREAGIESLTGCRLIATRDVQGRPDATAAVRFLHRRITTALARIDRLLPKAA